MVNSALCSTGETYLPAGEGKTKRAVSQPGTALAWTGENPMLP
jgi:hypothetical protein